MLPVKHKYVFPLYCGWVWRQIVYSFFLVCVGFVFLALYALALGPSALERSPKIAMVFIFGTFVFLAILFAGYYAFRRIAMLKFEEFSLSTTQITSKKEFINVTLKFWLGVFWRSFLLSLSFEFLSIVIFEVEGGMLSIFFVDYFVLMWCLKRQIAGVHLISQDTQEKNS